MPRRPLSELTPEEAEERREYMRQMKAESRARLADAGLCVVKTYACTGKAKKGGSTCKACDEVRMEAAREHAKKYGWQTRPGVKIPRTIRKLRRQGKHIRDIVKDPYLIERQVTQKQVKQVLKQAGIP